MTAAPGSAEAIEQGCLCDPVSDDKSNPKVIDLFDALKAQLQRANCPVHGKAGSQVANTWQTQQEKA